MRPRGLEMNRDPDKGEQTHSLQAFRSYSVTAGIATVLTATIGGVAAVIASRPPQPAESQPQYFAPINTPPQGSATQGSAASSAGQVDQQRVSLAVGEAITLRGQDLQLESKLL
jgi:hypothetical protein